MTIDIASGFCPRPAEWMFRWAFFIWIGGLIGINIWAGIRFSIEVKDRVADARKRPWLQCGAPFFLRQNMKDPELQRIHRKYCFYCGAYFVLAFLLSVVMLYSVPKFICLH